ncbi:hypothetical protein HX871_07145 [Pseudomonas reactans]|uniref:Uncharacterized protein n=1 Tax=Pseudomonas reactans TaxID=117680 RepID=A0ABX2QV02_9PSED|nr:hypothetical protein [Pseudomonas reactans]NWA43849.1 hypothetical protein [Pseudomonas reactans]NWD94186.1 hypothetical protein [Pseudomonas reactans]NWF12130.1 hypothetical protein [Pseudomonas reactans]
MDSTNSKITHALKSFWFFSSAIIFLSLVAAIWVYRSKFGGGLSQDSSDWSNFGSYMGGIFGPLVSFVTLLAVLKTVYLQRELLDVQQEEFERMNELQARTFDSQQLQINQAARDAINLQVAAAQDSAIKVIEMRVNMHERDFDRQHELAFRHENDYSGDLSEAANDRLNRILVYRERARMTVDLLSLAALDIAGGSFSTVLEVRRESRERIVDAYEKVDAAYPDIANNPN